jgi:hypothetical protein
VIVVIQPEADPEVGGWWEGYSDTRVSAMCESSHIDEDGIHPETANSHGMGKRAR